MFNPDAIATGLILAAVATASAQCDPLWIQEGPRDDGNYGWGAARLGDLNGDGVSEILCQFYINQNGASDGHILSGLTGQNLRNTGRVNLGYLALVLGDLDNDGTDEWLRRNNDLGTEIVSGLNTIIWQYPGANLGIMTCGDIDGDGETDFAVGDPSIGATTVYSGATRAVIGMLSSAYGRGLAAGDLNGDGVDDFLAGLGTIDAYSGADLSLIYSAPLGGRLGSTKTVLSDLNSDGAAEVALVDPLYFDPDSGRQTGRIVIMSGADGAVLQDQIGTEDEPIQGVYPAGDWNDDGVIDVALGSPATSFNEPFAGRISFRSGDDLRVIDRIDGDYFRANLSPTFVLMDDLPGQNVQVLLLWEGGYNLASGRVYLQKRRCRADLNCDGDATTLDVLAFLNLWNAGDTNADMNFDNEVNSLDMLAFLNLWNSGC